MINKEEILEVTDKNIFRSNNGTAFSENGLFSEKIFGPIKNFSCRCGKLNNQLLDSGKRCDKCGVKCIESESRFTTFGFINLPFMVIKPTKWKNIRNVIKNINKYRNTLLDPNRNDLNITQKRYIGFNKSDFSVLIFDERQDLNYVYLPLRITGIYSFILGLKYLANKFNIVDVKDLFDAQVFMNHIKVIPPGMRPVNFDFKENRRIQMNEVNKIYISLLNLNHSNKILSDSMLIDEEDIFSRIDMYFNQTNTDDFDEEIVESIVTHYDTITSRYQYYINQVYESLSNAISGKTGYIRYNMLGKTIDFSARSVVCCDPSLRPYEIGVGKKILFKLWMLYFLYYLCNIKKMNIMWCLTNVISGRYEDNRELFDEFLTWFYTREED